MQSMQSLSHEVKREIVGHEFDVQDISQWTKTMKNTGMKYAVLTRRHTSGFLLWDSATSGFDMIPSSTWKTAPFRETSRRKAS